MTQTVPEVDPFDQVSTPALKFPEVGTKHVMTVTRPASFVQSRNFESGELDFWDANADGTRNPKMCAVVNGMVDGEERSVWATKPSSLFAAIAAAQRAAGHRIEPGGTLTITFTHETPNAKNPRLHPKKEYTATYTPPSAQPAAAKVDPFAAPAKTDDEPPF